MPTTLRFSPETVREFDTTVQVILQQMMERDHKSGQNVIGRLMLFQASLATQGWTLSLTSDGKWESHKHPDPGGELVSLESIVSTYGLFTQALIRVAPGEYDSIQVLKDQDQVGDILLQGLIALLKEKAAVV
jgi:hypothetical protein